MPRRLWVIGDSWTDPGWGGFGWELGWPILVARRLGLSLVNSGRGGAGYVNPNGEGWTYPREVDLGGGGGGATDAVIVWGSINDSAWPLADLRRISGQVMTSLRAAAPNAVLIVYGPQYWDTVPWAGLALMTAEVRASAQAAGALFVDPLMWMQGQAALIDATAHPNVAGHAYLADRIYLDLLWALGPLRQATDPGHVLPWRSPMAAAAATLLEEP